MTNEEWIRGLDDVGLLDFLNNVMCDFCGKYCPRHFTNKCYFDGERHQCRKALREFLAVEHKEHIEPCKYCGGARVRSFIQDNSQYCIECCDCNARGKRCNTEAEAIKAWNEVNRK